MKISLSWLKEYIDIPWSPVELGERLTAIGLEVEGIEDQAKVFERFVVGHVKEVSKHPKADRLTVCLVDVGKETLQIVCGAPNVAAGQKVAVGLVGAKVPHDQHDPEGKPFTLGSVKLRGVDSSGMICSAKELGLGEDGDGIMLLDQKAAAGTPLAKHLGRSDVTFEIGITPNRADCLSHIGVAREVAMLTHKKVRLPRFTLPKPPRTSIPRVKIAINDSDLCPRYAARIVNNVEPKSSPKWLQDRLAAVGIRPINVIVDVTNYVMMEYGQPLHAFDLSTLREDEIVVRRAGKDRSFTTLDGVKRDLTPDTLMICDGKGPVAVAGVMGGENSEIRSTTRSVLIESATFQPASVRKTARAFGLSTEASYRFERGVDPNLPVIAADRAAALLRELAGGTIDEPVIDVYPGRKNSPALKLRVRRTNEILGTDIKAEKMVTYMERIGFDVKKNSADILTVRAPSYRMDIAQEIDLVEEVARVHGYDNIDTRTKAAIDFSVQTTGRSLQDELRTILVGMGFSEIMTLSLQQERLARLMSDTVIKVLNPVSAEMQVLRNSLIPAGLEAVRSNVFRSQKTLRLFEIGNVFRASGNPVSLKAENVVEEEMLTIYLVGERAPVTFDAAPQSVDLFDLKGEVEALLKRLHLDKGRFIPYDAQNALTEQAVHVEIQERGASQATRIGWLGRISGDFAGHFDIDIPVYVCELSVSRLGTGREAARMFTPLPKFPSVQRDVALVVDEGVTHAELEGTIRRAAGPLLESMFLFDVYAGSQAGKGKKSLAFALTFRSTTATLVDADVDGAIELIVKSASSAHGAVLRS